MVSFSQIFSFFLTFCHRATRVDFPENFGKIRQKSWLLGGFYCFPTPAPHVIKIGRRNSQRTIYDVTCLGKKEFLKNFH